MLVVGIDTAIRKTGYGILEMNQDGQIHILDCGLIKNSPSFPHSECLKRLSGGISQIVEQFHPNCAAIESAFVSKNIRTAMILSLARGAVIAKLAELNVPVYEYSPKIGKRAVTGNGSADKQQVANVLSLMSNLNISQIPDDATDALSLAYCLANAMFHAKTGAIPLPPPI